MALIPLPAFPFLCLSLRSGSLPFRLPSDSGDYFLSCARSPLSEFGTA